MNRRRPTLPVNDEVAVPLDEIEGNIRLQKRMSGDAPYYMLGPIATDIAPGFDHITAAIGAFGRQ